MNSVSVQTKLNNDLEFKTKLTYEVFGPKIGSAPIVLVNHALTGNSCVAGKDGWWNRIIGESSTIDTNKFTVLAFNIPGNGFDGNIIEDYELFTLKTISELILKGLKKLNIQKVHSVIGGSLGGALAWQLAYDAPNLFNHVIPIAAGFQTSDWLRAHCYLQNRILNYSDNPIDDARINAMLTYRTPQSINTRFKNEWDDAKNKYKIEDWLNYHGKALNERFQLGAYKFMNHLLSNIWVVDETRYLKIIKSNIHIIAIDSDLLFSAKRDFEVYKELQSLNSKVDYHEIKSIHGHDAFLIEYDQIKNILKDIFSK